MQNSLAIIADFNPANASHVATNDAIAHCAKSLGLADAEHEESAPSASKLFISRLACSLVGRTMTICLDPKSTLARLYGRTTIEEQYYCSFGVNPAYVETLR